jgi:hypothetical protein
MGKKKFNVGDKVIGNDKKGSYSNKNGTVLDYNKGTHEYKVQLENGETHFVAPSWFDKLDLTKREGELEDF